MTTLQKKFQKFRSSLSTSLVERDPEIELVLLGLLSKEHPLLVGLPGLAKSQLLDGIAEWVDAPKFSYLLTKFTDPMELFGPIDLESLKKGENRRNIKGYMPTASFAFLDEIFKASSSILNTLLNILNERVFRYGLQRELVPLILAVAASNEWPSAETMQELGALFDRFLLRKKVFPVSRKGRASLINRTIDWDDFKPSLDERISKEELERAYTGAMDLPWEEDTIEALHSILDELNRDGIFPVDRRIIKSVKIARAKAWLEGSENVKPEHLEPLANVLWTDPQEQPEHCEKVVLKIANPLGAVLYQFQQNFFDVEQAANEKLKLGYGEAGGRRIVEEVLQKGKEIETDLKTRRESPLRDKILTYVTESKKEWQRKLLQLPN